MALLEISSVEIEDFSDGQELCVSARSSRCGL
jgi:hypothetical protein